MRTELNAHGGRIHGVALGSLLRVVATVGSAVVLGSGNIFLDLFMFFIVGELKVP